MCGGDGSVGWALSEIDKLGYSNPPAIGILPLGTGNDLARTLGWGGGFDANDDLLQFLVHIKNDVHPVDVDRWKVVVRSPAVDSTDAAPVVKEIIMNNYFSLGIDAASPPPFALSLGLTPNPCLVPSLRPHPLPYP